MVAVAVAVAAAMTVARVAREATRDTCRALAGGTPELAATGQRGHACAEGQGQAQMAPGVDPAPLVVSDSTTAHLTPGVCRVRPRMWLLKLPASSTHGAAVWWSVACGC